MKPGTFAVLVAFLAGVTASHANITNTTFQAYNDGQMYCTFSNLTQIGPGAFEQGIHGDQWGFNGGTVRGDIQTDTPGDPSLTLLHSINNDTGYTWTNYDVTITMSQSFSLSGVTVDNGWSDVVTAPVLMGSSWVGYIDLYAAPYGTPVLVNGILDFGYTMSFTGSVSFSETLTPGPAPVPEPGVMALLSLGAAGWSARRRRKTV